MTKLTLRLPAINIDGRPYTFLDYLQFINDRSPLFNNNGSAIKLSIRFQKYLDAAREGSEIEIPSDIHSVLKSAIQQGPYPILPARRLQPFHTEIEEPSLEQPRANGQTEESKETAT